MDIVAARGCNSTSTGSIYEVLPSVAPGVCCGRSEVPSFPKRRRSDDPDMDVYTLTERQRDILQGIVDGLSNKEIGRRLGISHFTVRNHVSQLLKQLGLPSRMILRRSVSERETNGDHAKLLNHRDSAHKVEKARISKIPRAAADRRGAALFLTIEKAIAEGAKIDITLSVWGVAVSGCLVDGKAYFPELDRAFSVDVSLE
jgi:DNA-binding CsgD family transcriptional regulator